MNSSARRWWWSSRSNSAISGPASTMMLGTENPVNEGLAVGAEILLATAMPAEQVLSKFVGGRLASRLPLKLFGDRITHEIGEADFLPVKTRPQLSLELHRQT